jgi:hypothetical protein
MKALDHAQLDEIPINQRGDNLRRYMLEQVLKSAETRYEVYFAIEQHRLRKLANVQKVGRAGYVSTNRHHFEHILSTRYRKSCRHEQTEFPRAAALS